MAAKASSSGRSSAFDVFLADALLSRILGQVGGPFNFGGLNLTDVQRRSIADKLVKNAALVKFQTSTRQIVLTFDLPADDEVEPEPPAAADVAPEVLASILDSAGKGTRVLPQPDPEQDPGLSFNGPGSRPTQAEIRGGSAG